MDSVRKKLPIGYLGDKNPLNEILYGAKCHLEDVEPRLSGEQLRQVYSIVAATMMDTKKEYESPLSE